MFKKKKLILLTTVLLLFFTNGAFAYFFDGFESGDFSNWGTLTQNPLIDSTVKFSGNYSAKFYNLFGYGQASIQKYSDNNQFSFYFYLDDNVNGGLSVGLTSATSSTSRLRFEFHDGSAYRWYLSDSNTDVITTIDANTWYEARFDLNRDANYSTFSIYDVGSNLLGQKTTYYPTLLDNNKSIYFIGGIGYHGGDYNSYIDNFSYGIYSLPPITILTGCGNGWHNANKTITLTCDNNGSAACAATYYMVNMGANTIYTTPFLVSSDGNNKIDYYSKNVLDSVEDTNTSYCAIDKNSPSIGQTTISGFYTNTNHIYGSGKILSNAVTDSTSDINQSSCQYTINGIDWNAANWETDRCASPPITIIDGQTYYFNMRVSDNANNQSTGTQAIYYGDITLILPTTSFSYIQNPHSFDNNLTFTCSDNLIGCNRIYFNIDNNGWLNSDTNVSTTWATQLTHYYTLNESSGNAIDSKGSANATASNVIYEETGKLGKAFGFKGLSNSYLTLPIHTVPYSTSLRAIAGWIKTTDDEKTIYVSGSTDKFIIGITGGKLGCGASNTLTTSIADKIVNDGNWHFFACSYTSAGGGSTVMRTDNILGEIAVGVPNDDGTNQQFGNNGVGDYFEGTLDEISIWNAQLDYDNPSTYRMGGYLFNSGKGLAKGNNTINPNPYSFVYTGAGTHQIQFHSSNILDQNEVTKSSSFITYGDTIAPTTNFTVITPPTTTVTDLNVTFSLYCADNWDGNLIYDINKIVGTTNTNIYHAEDINAQTKSFTYTIPSIGSQYFSGSCTDKSGNTTSVDSNTVYATLLRLIDEYDGTNITQTDLNTFNIRRVYTVDGNFLLDWNVTSYSNFYFVGLEQPLKFEFSYTPANTPIVTRFIDVTKAIDQNIPVCVPVSPPLIASDFYQQRLTSNMPRTVTVYNTVSHCYDLIGNLSYVYDVGYAQTFYTINLPYEISTYYFGAKTVLVALDGAVSYSYNLDSLLFARSQTAFVIGQDTLAVAPKINPLTDLPDLNIVEIVYHAFNQDNTQLSMSLYNGSTLLASYVETTAPNDFIYEFYYPSYAGVTDQNFLRVIFTAKRIDGTTSTIETYFNILGEKLVNKIDYSFAAIVSVLFFLFGISLTSAGRTLGLFGIMVCFISIAICSFALQYWWVQFLMVGYIICLIYMIIIGKQSGYGGIL